MWFCRKSKRTWSKVSGMIWGGGGGESELLKVPRASKQNPTKALDQKLTIRKNPMLFQLFPLKGEDTEPSS